MCYLSPLLGRKLLADVHNGLLSHLRVTGYEAVGRRNAQKILQVADCGLI